MVRLKAALGAVPTMPISEFQFHNGSIKSLVRYDEAQDEYEFQFHNGSIKSPNNQQKILYKTRTISARRNFPFLLKVVNVRLCKIDGRLTRAHGYGLIEVIVGQKVCLMD